LSSENKHIKSGAIFIISGDVEKEKNETKFEAIFNKWLCPEVTKCDSVFNNTPPASAQTRMSEDRLALPDNVWYRSVICDGLRTSQARAFTNGTP
jgi:rubredoxin